uniref:unspecific monooxygenase n=1 Tax=Chilo suppressalis TaxID=168631 RepID=X5DQP4_CHISP|nr:CYP6AB50 [Chilo suppressalis]
MITIALKVILAITFYIYNVRNFGCWKKRGIKHDKPVISFGTNTWNILMKMSRSELAEELYFKYPKEKVVGFYRSSMPELLIRDPEIMKWILTSDFKCFYGHGAMFPLIVERCEKLQSRTLSAVTCNRALDARELMARYTTDFIGACGFGVDSDSLNDENSAFRKLGVKIFNISLRDSIVLVIRDVFPYSEKYLKLLKRIEPDILLLVKNILTERNYKPCGRNDFIDLMLEYLNKPMEAESIENVGENPIHVKMILNEGLFAAQVFVFFVAGFETSASSTSYTLHLLAFYPEVQKRVQADIDRILAKHDNKLSYEAVKEMTYLEWTFKEGLRMFPSLGFLMRRSTRKYKFEDINLDIDKGVNIVIPVQALHMDAKYWDDPDEFRPERFHPENFGATQKMVYFPFGEGPRNCIGSRLGLMQSMAGLAAILSKFTVEPAPETVRYPQISPKSNIIQSITGGLPLMFRERKQV